MRKPEPKQHHAAGKVKSGQATLPPTPCLALVVVIGAAGLFRGLGMDRLRWSGGDDDRVVGGS